MLHGTSYAIPRPPVPASNSPAPVPLPPVWVPLPSRSRTFVSRSRPSPVDRANGLYYMPTIYTHVYSSYQKECLLHGAPDSINTWTLEHTSAPQTELPPSRRVGWLIKFYDSHCWQVSAQWGVVYWNTSLPRRCTWCRQYETLRVTNGNLATVVGQ